MEINFIGHASIFVKTQDCQILMDPVLWDPHQEGLFDICPQREVIHENIPEFDLLIISHQHLDHFHIRSLAYLPKTVDVLIPEDKLIEDCLRQLGYSHIYPLKDFNKVKFGATSLLTTRSENRVPEYGVIFADASGVFWNQVDTIVSLNTIRFIKSRYEKINFLLAMWQPMLEMNYQMNMSLNFPDSIYSKILQTISTIQPQAVAPGSNGFRCIGGSAWLNKILFPVTTERFCHDVKNACPEIGNNVFPLYPGDVLTFDGGEFSHLKGKCPFVHKISDNREDLDFSPVRVGNEMIDNNPDNYHLDEMKEAICKEISVNLPKFITKNRNVLFIEHCRWQVIYQLEIVFPDGSKIWNFDFSQTEIQAQEGRNPLANLFTYMTASSLYGIFQGLKGWDYANLGGYYRGFQKLYIPTPQGITKPDEQERISEPLALKFPYREVLKRILQNEIAQWSHENNNRAKPQEPRTLMMQMGNTLVKLAR
ncbi:MBL fold metallo-hydrolase [Brasilonema sp. UFV-L1]|uniref:MBL fold metallo-hydrolase n=1 Tax=Brasilonema sp. UFV-L1 TaxID=2234130 RepID=UPI00145EFC34|nr:MBL fold metallo-hydrolase [Brasilonema sp. UFV-L1]NMG07820.1 MBL fold metallo-hydrolase [Brasilonema sp. UFV-L1]